MNNRYNEPEPEICVVCGNTDGIITERYRETRGDTIRIHYKDEYPFCHAVKYYFEGYVWDGEFEWEEVNEKNDN